MLGFWAEHERWRKRTKDLGLIPEPELMEGMRPGGKYETTANPEITQDGSTVKIRCATEGTSIGYTTESGDDATGCSTAAS